MSRPKTAPSFKAIPQPEVYEPDSDIERDALMQDWLRLKAAQDGYELTQPMGLE
jgi:hypothetical protein